jgi:hypothetical protein
MEQQVKHNLSTKRKKARPAGAERAEGVRASRAYATR